MELSEELGVSKASVSTMTRLLVRTGLLERVPAPGARSTYFRLREDGFEKLFAAKMEGMVAFRPLAERGLRLLPPDPEPRRRLRLLKALYAFFEREMPALLERWRAEREALVAEDEA